MKGSFNIRPTRSAVFKLRQHGNAVDTTLAERAQPAEVWGPASFNQGLFLTEL